MFKLIIALSLLLFFLFFFLSFLFPITFSSVPQLSSGTFAIYNATAFYYNSIDNYTIQIFSMIQYINKTFPNGSVIVSFQLISWNSSMALNWSSSIQNSTFPIFFYYVSPNFLGENITLLHQSLYYINRTGPYYVICRSGTIAGIEIKTYYFFNSDGLAEKVITLQFGENGQVVSKTVYTLWLTNFYNKSVGLPHFNVTTGGLMLNLNNSNYAIAKRIMAYIILFGGIAIILILLFRGTRFGLTK
ncbi:MAG: hypothetical protein QXY03_08020 [Saccharolobus sp.]